MRFDEKTPPKSVSSGYTPYRDLENENDVRILIYALSENVAAQLRLHGLCCRTVSINVRDKELNHICRQGHFSCTISDSSRIAEKALELFRSSCGISAPARSLTVCASDLVPYTEEVQLDLWGETQREERRDNINRAVDSIRKRYGYGAVCHAVIMQDKRLGMFDPKLIGDAHPVGIRR